MYHKDDFADLLKRYQGRAGLTQEELGRKVGVHRNTIDKWENYGSRPGSRGQVLRLADELILSKEERKAFVLAAGFSAERWPTEVWIVPHQRDMFFTGRDDVLQSLRQSLVPGSTAALTQAMSGLGGIGKTHLAIEYAYRFHQYYEAVLWLQADSWEVLASECMTQADELGLPEQKETDQVVAEVQRWLRKHLHWLLILDNVENPQEILSKFVPTRHQGCVLVTTRIQNVEPLAQTQVLSMMSEQEGVLFLLRRTTRIASKAGLEKANPEQYEEAKQIWQLMGGLPLALDQAGAYILETGCSFFSYREQYIRRRTELLRQRGKRFIGHEMPVVTTFSLALERVEKINSMAGEILRACSLLHSEAIAEEIFLDGAVHLGPRLAANPDGWDEAVGILRDYSLVQRNTEARMLTVHRLVQAVLQDTMHVSEQKVWTERVIAAINTIFPDTGHTTWSQCERLIQHVLVCAIRTQSWKSTNTDLASLLFKSAMYLSDRARYAEAELLYQQAWCIGEQALGPDHPNVAHLLNNLAILYIKQGKHAEAEPLYQRALSIREQYLGPQHPDTAQSLNGLANLYVEQGKYADAEPLYQRALRIREQALGPEHLDVAHPLNGLAILYRELGKYAKAEPLYQRALCILEQSKGVDHPDVVPPLTNLANIYREQGKYAEAEPLYQQALRILEQALGPEHPDVAHPLTNLANLYSNQGKYAEAEPLYQRALRIWQQALGPDHPLVAHPLNGLANLYFNQGKYAEAKPLYQQALAIREYHLGLEHLETAEILHDFAAFQDSQGNRQEAESLYQRALTIREKFLGQYHSKTIETRVRYATLLREMGRQDEAILLESPQSVQGKTEEEREAEQEE